MALINIHDLVFNSGANGTELTAILRGVRYVNSDFLINCEASNATPTEISAEYKYAILDGIKLTLVGETNIVFTKSSVTITDYTIKCKKRDFVVQIGDRKVMCPIGPSAQLAINALIQHVVEFNGITHIITIDTDPCEISISSNSAELLEWSLTNNYKLTQEQCERALASPRLREIAEKYCEKINLFCVAYEVMGFLFPENID